MKSTSQRRIPFLTALVSVLILWFAASPSIAGDRTRTSFSVQFSIGDGYRWVDSRLVPRHDHFDRGHTHLERVQKHAHRRNRQAQDHRRHAWNSPRWLRGTCAPPMRHTCEPPRVVYDLGR